MFLVGSSKRAAKCDCARCWTGPTCDLPCFPARTKISIGRCSGCTRRICSTPGDTCPVTNWSSPGSCGGTTLRIPRRSRRTWPASASPRSAPAKPRSAAYRPTSSTPAAGTGWSCSGFRWTCHFGRSPNRSLNRSCRSAPAGWRRCWTGSASSSRRWPAALGWSTCSPRSRANSASHAGCARPPAGSSPARDRCRPPSPNS